MVRIWDKPGRPAAEVAAELRRSLDRLFGLFLSPDGHAIDREAMATSIEFNDYVTAAGELQRAVQWWGGGMGGGALPGGSAV